MRQSIQRVSPRVLALSETDEDDKQTTRLFVLFYLDLTEEIRRDLSKRRRRKGPARGSLTLIKEEK